MQKQPQTDWGPLAHLSSDFGNTNHIDIPYFVMGSQVSKLTLCQKSSYAIHLQRVFAQDSWILWRFIVSDSKVFFCPWVVPSFNHFNHSISHSITPTPPPSLQLFGNMNHLRASISRLPINGNLPQKNTAQGHFPRCPLHLYIL